MNRRMLSGLLTIAMLASAMGPIDNLAYGMTSGALGLETVLTLSETQEETSKNESQEETTVLETQEGTNQSESQVESSQSETTEGAMAESSEAETSQANVTESETETEAVSQTETQEAQSDQTDEEDDSYFEGDDDEDDSIADEFCYAEILYTVNRTNGVRVYWESVEDVSTYYVFYKIPEGEWQLAGDTTKSYYTLTDAIGGNEYVFTVRTKPTINSILADEESAFLFEEECDRTSPWYIKTKYIEAPTISNKKLSGRNVTLTWKACTGAELYRVFYRAADSEEWTAAGDTKLTSFTIKSMAKNKRYYFTVQCYDAAGAQAASAYRTSTSSIIVGIIYSDYTGVDYTTQTASEARILACNNAQKLATATWTNQATFYTWCSSSGGYNSSVSVDGTRSAYYFLAGKEYTGIPYSMYNRTYTLNRWSSWLTSGDMTTSNMSKSYYRHGKKATAKGVDCSYLVYDCMVASGVTDNLIAYSTNGMLKASCYKKIDWYDLEPGDIILKSGHVMLFVGRTASGGYGIIEANTIGSRVRYYEDTMSNLYSSGYRPYRLRALAKSMNQEAPQYAMSTLSQSVSGAYTTLKWTGVRYVNRYQIQYRTGEGAWKTLGYTTGTSYKVTTTAGLQYQFRVRCISLDGKQAMSEWSNTKSRFYMGKSVVGSIRKVNSKLKISWTAKKYMDGYEVQVCRKSSFPSTKIKSKTVNAYTEDGTLISSPHAFFENLTKGKTYYIRIRYYKTVGERTHYSNWSQTVSYKF